jgi:4-amino-4-deoxy-L-arabinose transferase-like glycosyltransferase
MGGPAGVVTEPGHRWGWWLAAALALGLAIRLAFHYAYAPTDLPMADGLWYHTGANLFADGKGLIDPLGYFFLGQTRESAGHPPLFIILLGGVSSLGGRSLAAHQMTEIAFDVVAVGAIGYLGREVGGDRVGILAAFAAALFPRFWASEGEILSESLYTLVVAILLLLSVRTRRRAGIGLAYALGVTVALAALTRAEGLLFFPLLVVPAIVWTSSRSTGRLRLLGAAVLGILTLLGPWTAYNLSRFDHPVALSTGIGAVLAGANCDGSYHGDTIGAWDVQCAALPTRAGTRAPTKLPDESVESDALRDQGLRYARDHWRRVPLVAAVRVGRLLDLYDPHPSTFGPGWAEALLLIGWYAAIPFAIGGALVARRRRIPLLPFAATLVLVVLNAALTWGTPRFRVPLEISVVVLAAIAVDTVIRHRTGAVDRNDGPAAAHSPQPPMTSEGTIPR